MSYPEANQAALLALCAQYLRAPAATYDAATDTTTYVFTPSLTAAEQTTFDDLRTMARFGVTLTLAEWQSVKGDAAALRTFLGIASPTAAQTASATKSIIRVLATIIRS